MAEISDAEGHVFAATYHLVKALQLTKNLSSDVRRIVGELDIHLSTVMKFDEEEGERITELEQRLVSAQQTIMTLHSSYSKIWACSSVIILEYLQAVREVQRSIRTLEDMPLKRVKALLDQANTVLQLVMDRLQGELIHTLVQNKQCLEPEYAIYEESIISNEDDSIEDSSLRGRSSSETEEYSMDLIHPDVIPQIKSIADVMFASGYGPEFCQAFTGFWKDTLLQYSIILGMEQLSIKDVQQMEWKHLNSRIKNWCIAIKRIIGMYIPTAKRLFDQVLGEYGCISSACLIDASKGLLFCLLSFGQAVTIGPHQPEWLYCLLNMYEVLATLIPDLDTLEPNSLIRIEFHELLAQLGESVKVIIKQLGNFIESNGSTTPFPQGGVQHLTRYIVNYIMCFAEYRDTLHLLLQAADREQADGDVGGDTDPDPDHDPYPSSVVANYLQSLTSILEANLYKRSNLYRDCALKHIFLMNNIHYMIEKIKNSKIRPYFGDDWIRNYLVKFRQHAIYYERLTWSSVVTFLHDDGKVGKAVLKARCRGFTAAFEDLYKTQTGWLVPDDQLREEVRISASKTVIHAYRNFVEKIVKSIGEKHIKYSEQELGMYLLDLLEGSSKSLNHSRKR